MNLFVKHVPAWEGLAKLLYDSAQLEEALQYHPRL
jgi:hypothetical protein